MARRCVEITFYVPSSVSKTELREFITEALESSGGSRHPDDHLFHSLSDVEVRFLPAAKKEPVP